MRWLVALLALVLAGGVYWNRAHLLGATGPRPNVVLIVIDTLRADHLHGYGYGRETSPNLDRLMAAGARFDAAIAISSWSAPSHTTIVTGVPTHRHRVFDFPDRIADGVEPLASLFKQRGYATALFSTHLSLHTSVGRLTEGIDESLILANEKDAEVLEAARSWSKAQDRPFFLYIALMGPHAPYTKYPAGDDETYFTDAPPGAERTYPFSEEWWTGEGGIPKSVQLEDRHDVGFYVNRYDRAIRYTDELVGELLDDLRDAGLLDDAVLAVTSDHGEGLGDHDYFAHEVHLYDFLIRVPLIVVKPGVIEPGTRVEGAVGHVDIAPTLLGLAGLPVPGWMLGRDLSPDLSQGRPIDPDHIATSAYRMDDHDRFAARSPRYKLVLDATTASEELYDLAEDPAETRDLIEDPPAAFPTEEYERLRGAIAALRKEHVDLDPERSLEGLSPEVVDELRALGYAE